MGVVGMFRQWLIGIILISTAFFVSSCGQRVAVKYPDDYLNDSLEY